MTQAYAKPILDHFGLDQQSFLGSGGESNVYALDNRRVLRVFKPATHWHKVVRLFDFYQQLDASALSFQVPQMLEIDSLAGTHFALEARITGTDLTTYLRHAQAEARVGAIRNYIRAAAEVHTIAIDEDYYGEILAEKALQSKSWPDFLLRRASQGVAQAQGMIAQEVVDIEVVLDTWRDLLAKLAQPQRQVVHGDFFPGNVMVDGAGKVTAVIDFSPMTVIGDWRMDLAGAVIFLELTETTQPYDSHVAKALVDDLIAEDSQALLDFYRLYYSLYFAGVKEDDPGLYAWCVNNLKSLTP